METEIFELTEEHVKLLEKMHVGWESYETGAPAINCKRPYGNSDVFSDIAGILGDAEFDRWSESKDVEEKIDHYYRLHAETQYALQIALRVKSFEPGLYAAEQWRDWKKVDSLDGLKGRIVDVKKKIEEAVQNENGARFNAIRDLEQFDLRGDKLRLLPLAELRALKKRLLERLEAEKNKELDALIDELRTN